MRQCRRPGTLHFQGEIRFAISSLLLRPLLPLLLDEDSKDCCGNDQILSSRRSRRSHFLDDDVLDDDFVDGDVNDDDQDILSLITIPAASAAASTSNVIIVPLKSIEYGFGYIIIRSPYIPDLIH